ncbi:MAG: hypothetical protein ABL962_14880 [Fimbriimonadaceae bacterium]
MRLQRTYWSFGRFTSSLRSMQMYNLPVNKLVLFAVGLVVLGCSKGESGAAKPFLDQTRVVAPKQDWSREVVARKAGPIKFRIEAPGAFSLIVLTDKGFQAVRTKNASGITRSDVLLDTFKSGTFEGSIDLPAGSSWFVIRNDTAQDASIHLTYSE